jgi:Fe-S-cluster containining protein
MADEVLSEEEFLERVTDGVRQAAGEALKGRVTAASAEEATGRAVDFAEGVTRVQLETSPPERAIACVEGCAWCCHFPVAVSPSEVIRIADRLRATRSPAEQAALHARVAEADERRRSDPGAVARTPCPLLDGSRCSVYEVRPLSCRGCNSFDAGACERAYFSGRGHMPMYNAQYEIHSSALAGLLYGLRDRRLDCRPLELVAALRLALDEADAPRRWLAGARVWERAYFANVLPEVADQVLGGRADDAQGE